MDYNDCPAVIKEYLNYCINIKSQSMNTVNEYYRDLITFFRYIIIRRGLVNSEIPFEKISIECVDIDFVESITSTDIHEFLFYCSNIRKNSSTTRARKATTLRGYFKFMYLHQHKISSNPTDMLDSPKIRSSLPKHLTLNESIKLLDSIDGNNMQRDYLIITLFLNCGLRLSELCSLNINDIKDDGSLTVLGKGNKERVIYLNDACMNALKQYLPYRDTNGVMPIDKNALFISRNRRRLSKKTVQHIVYKRLEEAGLKTEGMSVHKLRHTAATLMYQHGNVDIRVLKELLGHKNLGTTQIYTHVSDQQVKDAINNNPLAKK